MVRKLIKNLKKIIIKKLLKENLKIISKKYLRKIIKNNNEKIISKIVKRKLKNNFKKKNEKNNLNIIFKISTSLAKTFDLLGGSEDLSFPMRL